MQLQFVTLDVFTQTPYLGNPLAIIRVPASLRDKLTEAQRQSIAREFNLSESVFLHDVIPSQDVADYDIFTPRSRMSFAGHPTIGTAIYLSKCKEQGEFEGIEKLRTVAGVVPFDFTSPSTSSQSKSLGTAEVAVPHDVHIHTHRLAHPFPSLSRSSFESPPDTVPLVSIVKGMAFNLVCMKDVEALGKPTSGLLPSSDVFKGEYLDKDSGWDVGYTGTFYYCDLGWEDTSDGTKMRALRTRSIGTIEDPGTGSASCALACYLALQKSGQREVGFHLTQGVEIGRRCDIYVRVTKTEDGKGIDGVKLRGEAVKVMQGTLEVGED